MCEADAKILMMASTFKGCSITHLTFNHVEHFNDYNRDYVNSFQMGSLGKSLDAVHSQLLALTQSEREYRSYNHPVLSCTLCTTV